MNVRIIFIINNANKIECKHRFQILNMNCFLLIKFTVDSIYLQLNEVFSIEYTKITSDYGMIILEKDIGH